MLRQILVKPFKPSPRETKFGGLIVGHLQCRHQPITRQRIERNNWQYRLKTVGSAHQEQIPTLVFPPKAIISKANRGSNPTTWAVN